MSMATMMAKLKLDTQDFASKLKDASEKMSKFATDTNKGYGKATASLKSHNLGLKDTARIVQGILVSQAFYRIANEITSATSALWEFNESLDYTKVTYTALFGNKELAVGFMDSLKEHSINTIFDYDTLSKASKKLLAYGMDYKHLMYIIGGITNLGAMSGDPAALDRISYAIGQIYSTGYLKAEEMRQLANAYVPIQRILKDKLGLTGEQLADVGNLRIPAELAIDAIVDYANEQFGAVGDAATLTITGLKNRIVDSLMVLGNEVTEPLTRVYKSGLKYTADAIMQIRRVYSKSGAGGVFEFLVPNKNMQTIIRAFLANVHNSIRVLIEFTKVAGKTLGNLGLVLMTIFNTIGPAINALLASLSGFLNKLVSSAAGARILRGALLAAAAAMLVLRVQTTGAMIVTALTTAVHGLSKALMMLTVVASKLHPVVLIILAIVAALALLMSMFKGVNSALSKFFGLTNSTFSGLQHKDILQPTNDLKKATDMTEEFNNRLSDGSDASNRFAEGLKNVGKEAKKTAKNLLSFDEVFRLTEPNSDAGGIEDFLGTLNGIKDIDLGFEAPDFSDFTEDFSSALLNDLKSSWLGKLLNAGVGIWFIKKLLDELNSKIGPLTKYQTVASKFANLLGKALIGALVGFSIDAVLQPFTSRLWAKLDELIGLYGVTSQHKISSTIGSVLGGAIGMVLGGPGGAVIGSAAGHLAGGIISIIWSSLQQKLNVQNEQGMATVGQSLMSAVGMTVKGALGGGLKGGLKGGLAGAVAGGLSGLLSDALTGWIAEEFDLAADNLRDSGIGQNFGAAIGGIVGTVLGGPGLGTIIGTSVGGLIGSLEGLFFKPIEDALGSPMAWGTVGATAGAAIGLMFGPIGSIIGGLGGFIVGGIAGIINEIDGDWELFGEALKMYGQDILDAFLAPFKKLADDVKFIWEKWVVEPFKQANEDSEASWLEIGGYILKGILGGIAAVIVTIGDTILKVFDAIVAGFLAIFGIHSPAKEMEPIGKNIMLGVLEGMKGALDAVLNGISDLCGKIMDKLTGWGKSVKESISGTVAGAKETAGNIWSGFTGGVKYVGNKLVGHATGGIFSREHFARISEGNKSEAIIPLENASAMQPFVNAVSDGITASLAPMLASFNGNNQQLQPLYVGTLIADERGLKELNRKMQIIQLKEDRR